MSRVTCSNFCNITFACWQTLLFADSGCLVGWRTIRRQTSCRRCTTSWPTWPWPESWRRRSTSASTLTTIATPWRKAWTDLSLEKLFLKWIKTFFLLRNVLFNVRFWYYNYLQNIYCIFWFKILLTLKNRDKLSHSS